jgi:hypothetical protein
MENFLFLAKDVKLNLKECNVFLNLFPYRNGIFSFISANKQTSPRNKVKLVTKQGQNETLTSVLLIRIQIWAWIKMMRFFKLKQAFGPSLAPKESHQENIIGITLSDATGGATLAAG